jgi:hypothetical protein
LTAEQTKPGHALVGLNRVLVEWVNVHPMNVLVREKLAEASDPPGRAPRF